MSTEFQEGGAGYTPGRLPAVATPRPARPIVRGMPIALAYVLGFVPIAAISGSLFRLTRA